MSKKQQRGRWPAALSRALLLEERIDLLRSARCARIAGRRIAAAHRIIRDWKRRKPFAAANALADRLRSLQIGEHELAAALAMPVTSRVRQHVQRTTLWRAYVRLASAPTCEPGVADVPSTHAFAVLAQPLIDDALAELRDGLELAIAQSGSDAVDVGVAIQHAREHLLRHVAEIVEKTCILELRVAKLRGLLHGTTPQQRYRSFIALLATQAYRKTLFLEYPVLLETVATRLQFARESTLAFLTRLIADAASIGKHLFGDHAPLRIAQWKSGAGDSHRRGRSVVAVTFACGRKILYKPRSLGVDVAFAHVVDWVNGHLPERPLRTAKVLDRGDYGWCEFVERADLPSKDAARDYYVRQGKLLALFYTLHANDLHCDNVIASGADPVYVDLETLFHPTHGICAAGARHGRYVPDAASPPTVIDTFMLPLARQISGASPSDYLDVSALASTPGQELSGVKDTVDVGSDAMRIAAVERRLGNSAHLPVFAGEVAAASSHVEDICNGFDEVHALIERERDHLLSANGLDAWFGGTTLRRVCRPTSLYMNLIMQALHPDFLRDALTRRALFERIYVPRGRDELNAVLPAEIADLEQLDAPYFSIGYDDEVLRDSRLAVVPGACQPPPRALARTLLSRLNESDRRAQTGLIRIMLGWAPERAAARTEPAVTVPQPPTVDALATALLDCSVHVHGDRYWMCQAIVNGGLAMYAPGLYSLYSGQLGLALFFGLAGANGRQPRYVAAALHALDTVRRWSGGGRRGFSSCGVFNGAMGYPYVLANLGLALGRDDLLDEALAFLREFPADTLDDGLDIIDGSAGCVLFLVSLAERLHDRPRDAAMTAALIEHFADRLVAAARPQRIGVGWPAHEAGHIALTGFAHGNAGFAAALYAAAGALERDDYRHLARQAIAYENSLFSAELGNWRDLRDADGGAMRAWCHGAPGIVLGRLIALEAPGCTQADRDVLLVDALRGLSAPDNFLLPAGNDSLCHGASGNAQILDLVARHADLAVAAEAAAHAHIRGPQSQMDVRFAPGLLIGAAGVAYALLRPQAPTRVPLVLCLQVAPRS